MTRNLNNCELQKVRLTLCKQIKRKWRKQACDRDVKLLCCMIEVAIVMYATTEDYRATPSDVIDLKYALAKMTYKYSTVER